MKNLIKFLVVSVGVALIFSACHKEEPLPLYLKGNAVTLSSSATTVAPPVADSSKTALTLSWTWPNYATDSINQKFVIEIDSTKKNFANPYRLILKGVTKKSFTAKELNQILFGFGVSKSALTTTDIRVISSYANNNELYTSNVVTVGLTPYILPITLQVAPVTPLTLVMTDAANTAITCNWTATQFGNQPLSYAVQIDKTGGNWSSPTSFNFGTARTGTIKVVDLNRAIIAAGVTPGKSGTVNVRVIAYQGTNYANPLASNVVALTATTYLDVVKFWVVGGYNGWDNSDKALFIQNTQASGSEAQGYLNFASDGEFKLTTDHSWNDGATFGDDGSKSGKLKNPGNNINVTAGYYLVKADILKMTYNLTKTVWGVIGTSTPGGWGAQTDMTYYGSAKVFGIGLTMPAGEFKFRGTSDWGINFGSSAKDGKTLNYGGDNIAIAAAGDYAITLDLSQPNNYTYSANTWGVIGSATANGWNSDQNMSWDATNKVFTATLTLTAGEIKFRANDDWAVNLGGTLSALTGGGANIAVPAAGTYKITLDPWNLKATVTKI